ncbi:DEAD/DEAH box helicase [Actinoplanes sp. NEAU-A11]|uniref:DEAD/DEAH box helicase n=2 Tax=Actinoplanes aureus TaxID=2792083 RepID=A0A931FVZ5_9ACTN|nr:DEAD/DEAH box helicase [Actinoplanes aureus]
MSAVETSSVASGGMRSTVPEPGQVVEVRGSTWAVAKVEQQGLPRSPADEAVASLNHAITLQALDEDRLGEELTVVWELEVGHTVTPAQGLPTQINRDAFDDPNTLAGFVDAMRWGAVTSADDRRVQAPFHSGVTVEAYQLEPLRRALSSPRTNLLLADDVGLGKTIEAGLVVQELLLRHRARTAIVVCPPSLALKWQDEMRDKFGLEFTIINSDMMRDVRRRYGLHANPFQLFPRVIVSMAWLPSVRAQRMLRDVFAQAASTKTARRYAFDIMIVDEAHHVAPASPSAIGGGRGYAVDTQRTIAVRELAEKCEHRLFLSATPHNGHPESFTALMEMIDSRRFSRGALLDEKALTEVTVRRLKSDPALAYKNFRPRELKGIAFTPSAEEQEMFSLLDRILTDSAKANRTGASGDITAMLFKKRFLSSPWAFGMTLQSYLEARSVGQEPSDWDYDDILGEGQSDEEEGLWEQDEATVLRNSKSSDPLVAAGTGELERLAEWGLEFASRPDSRLDTLIRTLEAICRPSGFWSNDRVVIFTEYAHTLEWVQRVLVQQGYDDVLEVIQGQTPTEERELIREHFTTDPARNPVRVLLATDAAGEGIDLQDYCHRLINLDIPFNPSRLEQRIGRIDRYGQKQTPLVYQFMPDRSATIYAADMQFMGRIAQKVVTVARDLGSVNQVIAEEIQDHFTRTATTRRGKKVALDGNAVITRALAGGMDLNSQLTQLEQGYDDSKAQLHLEPDNLRRVVDTALRISHQPPLTVSGDHPADDGVYVVPALGPAWQSTLKGLDTRSKPGVWRPITFNDQAAAGNKDVVYVHLGHPLVKKAQRLLRRSLWSVDAPLHRVTAVVVDDLEESFVAAVTRMVLVGRGGLRLHEEIFLAGVRLRGRRAIAEERAERLLDQALDSGSLILAATDVRDGLVQEWNEPDSPLRARLFESMSRRAETRQQRVSDQLTKREQADVTRAREIFAAFRRNLNESLDVLAAKEAQEAATLLPDDQQRQRQRDMEAMRRRLDELGDEETREVAAITERYRDIKPHTTAAAVVFALTPADAQRGGAR